MYPFVYIVKRMNEFEAKLTVLQARWAAAEPTTDWSFPTEGLSSAGPCVVDLDLDTQLDRDGRPPVYSIT